MVIEEENSSLPSNDSQNRHRWRFTMRGLMIAITIVTLLSAWLSTTMRLRQTQAELTELRLRTGYLQPSDIGQIAAVRLDSDEPLTYRFRIRVPQSTSFRVAYSTDWPKGKPSAQWYSAVAVQPGESEVLVQIREDLRDQRWKITTMIKTPQSTQRSATVLPDPHVSLFRQSVNVISCGTGRQTQLAEKSQSIRLLDERWLVGESGLLLYGNTEPADNIIGVFAELQPDTGPLQRNEST